jgi:TrmH family RNA methyltransferase
MLSKATIKDIQSLQHKKFRDESHTFSAEGPKVVHELLQEAAFECVAIYGLADWIEREIQLLPDFEKYMHVVTDFELSKLATYSTPNKVVAVFKKAAVVSNIELKNNITLVLDDIQDPGNLGTIFRSAEAAGASAVVLTPGTVEAFNPKVVRASAGSMFYVPIIEDVKTYKLQAAGFRVIGTSSHDQEGSIDYTSANFTDRVAIVVGNEAHGLVDSSNIDQWVMVPHRGRSESLNVAMAATLVCFEVAKQRDHASSNE